MSVATASRALGGGTRTVTPENVRKVLAAASALRYTVDVSARAMNRKSDAIVLVADDLTSPSIAVVLAAMERRARLVDGFVTVSSTRGIPERQLETVRKLCAFRPRALVLTSSRIEATAFNGGLLDELLAYEHNGGRVVIYGSIDLPFDSIGVDDRGSARLMGAHLAGTGHRRVVILAGTLDRAFSAARAAGCVEGLVTGGVRDVRIITTEVSRQGGFDAVTRLIREGLAETDAIVAVNDTVAVGALSACRAAGVAVPDRVSVAGFDDIPLARDVTPQLTTVAVPFADIGARAIRLALTTRAAAGEITRETVRGTLVVRDSTAARPR
ncbi:LacI family transcriptional regulator [Streptosporangium sp. KLBMP 9127]|nr:LacI family transcriptional regulator [Streptosporangium sp. KLBMP 9127]